MGGAEKSGSNLSRSPDILQEEVQLVCQTPQENHGHFKGANVIQQVTHRKGQLDK